MRNARRKIEKAAVEYRKHRKLIYNDAISYIGVHVRRKDYSNHLRVVAGLQVVNESYLSRAMEIFRNSEKHPLFIIVSDDMDWTRKNIIPNDGDCAFLGTGSQGSTRQATIPRAIRASPAIGNDLALLTLVNYTIMTYGTFGMWGALLAGSKIVILPDGYDKEPGMKEIRAADIEGWIFI